MKLFADNTETNSRPSIESPHVTRSINFSSSLNGLVQVFQTPESVHKGAVEGGGGYTDHIRLPLITLKNTKQGISFLLTMIIIQYYIYYSFLRKKHKVTYSVLDKSYCVCPMYQSYIGTVLSCRHK